MFQVATGTVAAAAAADTKTGSLVPAPAPQSKRTDHVNQRNGGLQIAKALLEQRVKYVFTLTGGKLQTELFALDGIIVLSPLTLRAWSLVICCQTGHIAPMLVGCNAVGIRVVDVRDEVTTCFAADAAARITGVPGVAMVTAGPGTYLPPFLFPIPFRLRLRLQF